MYDSVPNEVSENNDIEILKQRQFIEKLQRLSSLKRKSEEYLQKNYYSEIVNTEKRPKISDKLTSNKSNILQTSFDNIQSIYEENPINITKSLNPIQKQDSEKTDSKTHTTESEISLKAECDDSDIIVSDPAVCTTPKSYESPRDIKKNLIIPLDYQSPQESKCLLTVFNTKIYSLQIKLHLKICALRVVPHREHLNLISNIALHIFVYSHMISNIYYIYFIYQPQLPYFQ